MAAAVTLIFSLVFFRLAAVFSGDSSMLTMANFSPMAAIVLCGALFFPWKWAVIVPLSALLLSDLVLNIHYGQSPLTANTAAILLSFAFVFWIGSTLRRNKLGLNLPWLLGGSMAGSLIFYLITNSSVWLMSSSGVYARTLEGWIQCMTVGTPGFPPTYVFLRNSLSGDLFFTATFWIVLVLSAARQSRVRAFEPTQRTRGVGPARPL